MAYYPRFIPKGPAFKVDFKNYMDEAMLLLEQDHFEHSMTEEKKKDLVHSIHRRFIEHLKVYKDKSIGNFEQLQNELNAPPSIYVINKALGDLYLSMLYDKHKVETPKLATIVKVKESKPIISPSVIAWNRLSEQIYNFLDEAEKQPIVLINPMKTLELLCLQLLMNEYVKSYKQVALLISQREIWTSISGLWIAKNDDINVVISPKTMTLLWAYWASETNREIIISSNRIANIVKNCLVSQGIIRSSDTIKISNLKAAEKIEKVVSHSPVEYRLFTQDLKSSPLELETLYRLISGIPVRRFKDNEDKTQKATHRQVRAWKHGIQNSTRVSVNSELAIITNWLEKIRSKTKVEEDRIKNGDLQNEIRFWLEESSNAREHPLAWLLIVWMYQLITSGTKYKHNITLSTIRDYVSSVAKSFVHEFSDIDITLISGLEWAEKLNDTAEAVPGKTKRGRVRYFAEFLVESHLASDMRLSDLDINGVKTKVDANILTHQEAEHILNLLHEEDTKETNLAQIVFILGFYLGLRRGEITGLQFDDFYLSEKYSQLHVRLNRYRRLKSTNSARNLPMECLMTRTALKTLNEFLERTDLKTRKQNDLIFDNNIYSKDDINKAFNLVGNIMRQITGDDNIRFHHLRHSFCNWTWFLINLHDYTNISAFHFLNHSYFTANRCDELCERLGLINNKNRNRGWILAELLGHSHISTTFASYFHLTDIHRLLLEKQFFPSKKWLTSIWGYRHTLDNFGAPLLPKKAVETYKTHSIDALKFTSAEMIFDLSGMVFVEKQDKNIITISGMTLDKIYRIIRRYEEKQTYGELAQGLEVDLDSAKFVCSKYDLLKHEYSKNYVSYSNLKPRDEKMLEDLVKGYIKSKNSLDELANDASQLINNLVAAKSNIIRSANENSIISFLKLLKEIGVEASQISVEWYVSEHLSYSIPDFITKLQNDVTWWSQNINAIFGYREVQISGLVNESLIGYLATNDSFHWRTTLDSTDGIHLKYQNRGNVKIRVVAKKYRGDNKGKASKRSSKGLVYFLQILKIYTDCKRLSY